MKRILFLVGVSLTQVASAQFQQIFTSSNNSWHFQGNANRLGVGRFPLGNALNPNLPATLTVDGRTLNQFGQPANQTGDVFFTYSPVVAGQPTRWRMHYGNTPIGQLFNNGVDAHFRFQAMQNNSSLILHNAVGIGAYGNNAVLPAVLSVDANLVNTPAPNNTVFQTNGVATQPTFWRMQRGGVEMGSIFNNGANTNFEFRSAIAGSDIVFRTLSATAAGFDERMRLNQRLFQGTDVTGVTISENPQNPIAAPASLLHIGFSLSGGWRNWMDVGTYTSTLTDNMYVGMKNELADPNAPWDGRQSAVISWGNNPTGQADFTDRLRFIFTSFNDPAVTLQSETQDGLEVARMVTNGNVPRMGIGNFMGANTFPGDDPTNTLEIRSDVDPALLATNNITNAPTRSGLRFSNLDATLAVDAASNSTNTVLSVNDQGDVILVEDRGGLQGCNNPLVGANGTGHAGIQLNTNNFYFIGQDDDFDRVGVGLPCGAPIKARFEVEELVTAAVNAPTTAQIAAAFRCTGTYTGTNHVASTAVMGTADALASFNLGVLTNTGGRFIAKNNKYAYGVMGEANDGDSNYGGYFSATGGSSNYGLYASVATAQGGSPNDIAALFNGDVYGTAGLISLSDKNLKANITPISSALNKLSKITPSEFSFINTPYVSLAQGKQFGVIAQEVEAFLPELVSNITIPDVLDETGAIVHPSQTWKGVNYTGLIPITIQGVKELDATVKKLTLSDAQLKQNVQPLQNSLHLIRQLNGVSYQWNQQADTTLSLPSGTEIGLIAQSVEAIIPEVVFTDDRGYKNVAYQKIVPHLIEANKQLQDSLADLNNQLQALSQQVAAIQNCMNNLPIGMNCNGVSARIESPENVVTVEPQKVVLESSDAIILYQNQPNPFDNTTIIRYFIPEIGQRAEMVFHDEYGREINRVQLEQTGLSQLEISAENLASGVYTYSLVVGDKLIDTKKMIKVR